MRNIKDCHSTSYQHYYGSESGGAAQGVNLFACNEWTSISCTYGIEARTPGVDFGTGVARIIASVVLVVVVVSVAAVERAGRGVKTSC